MTCHANVAYIFFNREVIDNYKSASVGEKALCSMRKGLLESHSAHSMGWEERK